MSQDEITVMDGSKCIFQLRGIRPFLSDKFDITKHKNYKLLEDYDKKNVFDIEDYIKRKGKVKLNRNTVIQDCNIFCYSFTWHEHICYNKMNLKLERYLKCSFNILLINLKNLVVL